MRSTPPFRRTSPSGRALSRLLLASGVVLEPACASAQAIATSPTPPAADTATQVRNLTALVERLSAQVQSLQAQLDARGDAPVPAAATPRALQNAGPLSPVPAAAPESEARFASGNGPAEPRVLQNETHIFNLASPSGAYTIGFAGVVQFDVGDYLTFQPRSRYVGPQELSSGANARRARLGFAGKAAGDWSYAFIYDAGNSQDTTSRGIETAQIVYGGIKGAALELGYSNTFFTLDQSTSSNDLLFLERASPSNIATAFNAGDNRANAGVRLFGDRYWIGGYLTGPASSSDSHTGVGERLGAFQRAAFQVLKGPDYNLHLGVDVDELIDAPTTGAGTPQSLTLSDPPEVRLDPTALLNTGALGTTAHPFDGGHVLDLETAAEWRSLFWQGELYHYDVGRRGLPEAGFGGAYGEVAWTLTGERHRYNPQAGAYYRIYPARPFSLKDGGLGAFELAARVSYVDLDSMFRPGTALSASPAAIDGGRQTGCALGLNWYPNDLLRFLLDYDHVDFDKRNGAAAAGAALGVPVGDRLDALTLRSQIVF